MSRFDRGVAGAGGTLAILLLGGVGPAYAGDTFQQCVNQAINHNGEPPTCTDVNGSWVPSWPGDPSSSGGGIPGAFIALFVIGILIAVGITVWKVSTAQKLARQSGMDPGLATRMTLLTGDGLDATYLAASLRRPPQTPAVPTAEPAPAATQDRTGSSAAERLTELKSLLDRGLITSSEYDERRKLIIDTV